jgi:low affinity Fe/Cu permease
MTAFLFNNHQRKIMKKKWSISPWFNSFSTAVTKATGTPTAFLIAMFAIVLWAVSGPLFHFSDTWQLVINTATTIVTFLMVFVIQQSQNKDTMALHIKLNELIAANKDASNRVVNIEDLSEEELVVLKKFYIRVSDLAEKDQEPYTTHSINDAHLNQAIKTGKLSSRHAK